MMAHENKTNTLGTITECIGKQHSKKRMEIKEIRWEQSIYAHSEDYSLYKTTTKQHNYVGNDF